ncbi:MAG: hypothetical protein PWQ23_1122 [Thermoanaerobacter sp.]|jgi:hypothetical protein|uniref:Uncharacterized protein n=1 Tax=Thermoanaerobacter brockii subsp. finnii (strain ATCC 43586 / DSM 3389 / AKO-1) TaxID=509193 RepID=E8UQW1_THEBF|nr:hypothetical protein Thebr_2012 [Thermoanaerobacter brockii subsp. finnii Ako-1]MDI3529303.1 hypothetical protein [Thermoanaerobacter sp.]
MLKTPNDINLDAIKKEIEKLPGVKNYTPCACLAD